MNVNKEACTCKNIKYKDIIDLVLSGVTNVNDVQDKLRYGTGCGKCVEPGEYEEIRRMILWFVDHADDKELLSMGKSAYEYLRMHLTKEASVRKYVEAINRL